MCYLLFFFPLAVPLTLFPRIGHMLGGNGVLVNGPCLDESDLIKCVFDDQESPEDGIYIADTLALCIVPVLPKNGYIPFQLSVEGIAGTIPTHSSTFTACNYV